MTTHPRIKSPDSGLSFYRDTWRAEYTVDGKRRYRSLGTTQIGIARLKRDEFYAKLDADGAKPSGTVADPDSMRYIYTRKPVILRLGGKERHFDTVEEAKAARNKLLGV
jgi:hypothetical protein